MWVHRPIPTTDIHGPAFCEVLFPPNRSDSLRRSRCTMVAPPFSIRPAAPRSSPHQDHGNTGTSRIRDLRGRRGFRNPPKKTPFFYFSGEVYGVLGHELVRMEVRLHEPCSGRSGKAGCCDVGGKPLEASDGKCFLSKKPERF